MAAQSQLGVKVQGSFCLCANDFGPHPPSLRSPHYSVWLLKLYSSHMGSRQRKGEKRGSKDTKETFYQMSQPFFTEIFWKLFH